VANAVLDGVDGMLLGAETLRGEHPVLTVETVLRLTAAAEKYFDYRTHHEMLMGEAYEVGGWVGGWVGGRCSRCWGVHWGGMGSCGMYLLLISALRLR
jgi:hypothetical protein